jgi:hypothetical protein
VTPPAGLDLEAEMANRIASEGLPDAPCPEPLAPGDRCHLVTPVRFGRRKSDPLGHLHLTSGWLKFRGPRDLSVVWTGVAGVARVNCDVIVSLADSHRVLRFCCQSASDASRVFVLTRHLTVAGVQ